MISAITYMRTYALCNPCADLSVLYISNISIVHCGLQVNGNAVQRSCLASATPAINHTQSREARQHKHSAAS